MSELLGKKRLLSILLALVTAGVYANTLLNGFVYDDNELILKNPWILDARFLPEIFTTPIGAFLPNTPTGTYRPMVHAVYLVEHALFGLAPGGFHLVNLVLNSLATVAVFLTASRILEREGPSAAYAFAAALLFALHPAHSEVGAWVSAQAEMYFTILVLAAFWLHASPRHSNAKGAASSALFFAALLFKETALVFPLLAFAYDISLGGGPRSRLISYAAYIGTMAVYFIIRVLAVDAVLPGKDVFNLTGLQYLINVTGLVPLYFQKLFFPYGLNAYYGVEPLRSAAEPWAVFSIAFTALLMASLVFFYRRERTLFLCLSWAILSFLPALYLPGLGKNWFSERYLYLPSFGICLLVAASARGISGAYPALRASWAKSAALSVTFAISALFAYSTIERNAVWRSELTLWSDTVVKSPRASMPRMNLGDAYFKMGQREKAIAEFRAAVALDPDSYLARYNLAFAYHTGGNLDEAAREYMASIAIKPDNELAHFNMGLLYGSKGMLDEAEREFRTALSLKPDFPEVRKAIEDIERMKKGGD